MAFPSSSPAVTTPDTGLEPGDRFEIPGLADDRSPGCLPLPDLIRLGGVPIEVLEDEHGRPLQAELDLAADCLRLADGGRAPGDGGTARWLEYQAPGRFRLVAEATPPPADGELATEQGVPIVLAPED